jgi:Flp pilus assembly protein TadD
MMQIQTWRVLAQFALTSACTMVLNVAVAADSGRAPVETPTASVTPDALKTARALIAAKRWSAAIDELKRVNEASSADWNNLMGYSLRRATVPDLAVAERFYDEALRIDPKHRGALEYSGELYLMLGDLPKAEERLAALDKTCWLPCEEHTDLKKAIHAFKANGSRNSTNK